MGTGWRITPHTLLESADKEIGFFLAKSVEHTWRDGMWSRLTDHLISHGLDVPIAVRENRIKATEGVAHVVSVFAGAKDVTAIETCLEQHPFTDCELLLKKHKHSNQEEWKKSIDVHQELTEATRAVKIVNADDSFLRQLRLTMEQDDTVKCKVIDIAHKGFQDARDTLYVQCHQLHKDNLASWLKRYINHLNLTAQNPKNPRVDDGITTPQDRTNNQNSRQSNAINETTRPLTKFHYMHGDASFQTVNSEAGSKGRSSRSTGGRRSRGSNSIPTHVDLDVSSWADVVKKRVSKTRESSIFGENHSQQSQETDKSTIASVKSHREQELEIMVEKLSIENVELKEAQQITLQTQQDLMDANRELIGQIQTMKTQLVTVKDDIRKEFDTKIDTIFELF